MGKKIGKNSDGKSIKREGNLDVASMILSYHDEKTESTFEFDLSEPFKEYDGEDIEVTISITKVAKPKKETTVDGEVIE